MSGVAAKEAKPDTSVEMGKGRTVLRDIAWGFGTAIGQAHGLREGGHIGEDFHKQPKDEIHHCHWDEHRLDDRTQPGR